jgi:cytosine deaminase
MLDLLFKRAANPGYSSLIDIGVQGGNIIYLSDTSIVSPPSREIHDLQGKLLLASLVEPHIHLDKALLLDRMGADITALPDAIAMTSQLKRRFTSEDMEERSIRVIRQAVSKGVTLMRCHAEVDPIIGLSSMETMLALKKRFADIIDLQVVAFPQEGIYIDASTPSLLQQAIALGADAVGGITYIDRDTKAHLDFVFRLAQKHGIPVDLHVDFSDDPEQLAIVEVIKATREYGMQGRVSVGHLTSLGAVGSAKADGIASAMADTGIHVMSLPITDLYLNGRGDAQGFHRGLTPVKRLLDHGVNVVYGSNNIQNAFTPFGNADPLEVGLVLAQTCHLGSENDAELLVDMATNRAATALGRSHRGVRLGAVADLIVCPAKDTRTLLYERPERERVYRKGRLVAQTQVMRSDWYTESVQGIR